MKIIFYSHTGKVSGAENILLLILKKLNRKNFEPIGICPAVGGLAEIISAMKIPVVNVDELEARFTWRFDLFAKYLFSFWGVISQLRLQLRDNEAAAIHANSIRAGLVAWMASLFTGKPVFWHLQDELPKHPFSTAIRFLVAFSSRIRLLSASHATLESFRGKLLNAIGKNVPSKVIHNAIELEKFEIDSKNHTKIRKELNITNDEFVFAIIGQITPRKGQLELIETFAATQKELRGSTLLIVGAPMFIQDFDYFEELEETAKRLKIKEKVRFLGLRNDIPALMQAVDALVINSKSEALVVVAIEAMACGTPVIATDVGGTCEIIQNHVNGWLIPFGDPARLAEALIECASDPELRRSFAAKSRQIVGSQLNAERFISKIEEFFSEETQFKKVNPILIQAENQVH